MGAILRERRVDAALILTLFALGAGLSLYLSGLLPTALFHRESGVANVWFQADAARVFENMTVRKSDHYRTAVHPLFTLLTNPLSNLLSLFGVPRWTGVRMFLSTAAGLALALTFATARFAGLVRQDAVLVVGLLAVSSSFVFWSGVPETFVFGGASIVVPLMLAAYAIRNQAGQSLYVVAGAISMSVTITNMSAAIAAAIARLRLGAAFRAMSDALLVVLLLWTLQKLAYPSAGFFLGDREELRYTLMRESAPLIHRWGTMALHSFLMPTIEWASNTEATGNWPRLTIEHTGWQLGLTLSTLALLIWLSLLMLGLVALRRVQTLSGFRLALLGSLSFQLVLHAVYGDETFLYSLHWLPMLVLLVGCGMQMIQGWWLRLAIVVLIVLAAWNNFGSYQETVARLHLVAPASEPRGVP